MMNTWTLQMGYPLSLIPLRSGCDEHMDPADELPADHCNLCVQDMMNTWTLQMGYPLVTVTSVQGMMNTWTLQMGYSLVTVTSVCRV
jgi:hypothetical protein